MIKILFLTGLLVAVVEARADRPLFDLDAIRDARTLETTVIQDWKPSARDKGVLQKLIEVTICEWWVGQKVRIPITFNVPADRLPCTNVLVMNMGLGAKPAAATGGALKLLKEDGVGVVLVGMGTIDAMRPVGQLHLGMKRELLRTKDVRFTPAWIWGMSQMRGLTAAKAEPEHFRPFKVLATGGSKRGVATAVAGIHDDRFTAILPVVAPPLGNPGGPVVLGTEPPRITAANNKFFQDLTAGKLGLPESTKAALDGRTGRREATRVTTAEAKAAGWSDAEIAALTDRSWDACRITDYLPQLRARGLEFFYNVGSNDSVSPALKELGNRFPDFPIYIVPGGQHGGPADAGFTRRVPSLKEVQNNFVAFAQYHFLRKSSLMSAPSIRHQWNANAKRLTVTTTFSKGESPGQNHLWWSVNRHEPFTLAFEYDEWQSVEMKPMGNGRFHGELVLEKNPKNLEFITVHSRTAQGETMTISSPLGRFVP